MTTKKLAVLLLSSQDQLKFVAVQYREGGDVWLFITLVLKFYNNVFLFVGFITLGTLVNFDCFFKLSVQMFQPLFKIYSRGNFVYNHWECSSLNLPLSYPCRFLKISIISISIKLEINPQSFLFPPLATNIKTR